MLPRAFGRLERRRSSRREAIVIAGGDRDRADRRSPRSPRTAIRVPREPLLLRRPDRVHGGAARGHPPALQRARARAAVPRPERARSAASRSRCRARRAPLTFAIWVAPSLTHRARATPARSGSRRARRLRRRRGARASGACSSTSTPVDEQLPAERGVPSGSSCPMKLGDIGEEMVATAIKLAEERGAAVEALTWSACRATSRSTPSSTTRSSASRASLEEARLLGADHGVEVDGDVVRARSIGEAIVDEADARRRPDRPRLGAALAAPVAVLHADGRLRPAPGALRGAGRRLPGGRPRGGGSRTLVNARRDRMRPRRLGGRQEARGEGWDVTAIDENEEALGRLGADWRGGFVVGHGMDVDVLERAGLEDADAVVVATNGDNTNIVVGQVAAEAVRRSTRVVVRILDPARAELYADRGLRTSARRRPRSRAARSGARGDAASEAARPDVRHRRGRRQGRLERRRARCSTLGHEVTLIEQRRDRFDAARGGVRAPAHPRRRHRARRARARGDRAAARPRPRGHGRRRGQHRDLPDRGGGVRRREGDRARQRPAQPAALRPARHLADRLRDDEHPRR